MRSFDKMLTLQLETGNSSRLTRLLKSTWLKTRNLEIDNEIKKNSGTGAAPAERSAAENENYLRQSRELSWVLFSSVRTQH